MKELLEQSTHFQAHPLTASGNNEPPGHQTRSLFRIAVGHGQSQLDIAHNSEITNRQVFSHDLMEREIGKNAIIVHLLLLESPYRVHPLLENHD